MSRDREKGKVKERAAWFVCLSEDVNREVGCPRMCVFGFSAVVAIHGEQESIIERLCKGIVGNIGVFRLCVLV